MSTARQTTQARLMFMLAGGVMLAHQVAGKAVRDSLFLSRFEPSDLPKIVAAAAVLSILLGLPFVRIMSRFGPQRLVPAGFLLGGALHLGEYYALTRAGATLRGVVTTFVYLHLVSFSAILLSGFWSTVNETFDPREAKAVFGKIAGAGTIGGVVGGLLAVSGSALYGDDSLLLLLSGLQFLTAGLLLYLPVGVPARQEVPEEQPFWHSAREAFRGAPFLVNLAVLVLFGTITAALLDYLFKSNATIAFGKGTLTRFFALFYAGNQVLSFAMQAFLTPVALRRLGLGKTVRWHPAVVAIGTASALVGPPMLMSAIARGVELVLRGSFLRAGYELFFTPIPPREKRSVKTFIDVGCDRMGDAAGAAVLQALLMTLGPARAVTPILLITVFLSLIAVRIASRMDQAYVTVLEHGLVSRAVALNEVDVEDSTTLSALLMTREIPRVPRSDRQTSTQTAPVTTPLPPPPTSDETLARLAETRSGVPKRVAGALRPDLPFDAVLVPQAIRLLAWNETVEWARAYLLLHAHRIPGQLVDALLDQDLDFAVRRRLPRILAYSSSQRAVDGLTLALSDSRFEIRYHVSRALEFLHRMSEGLTFDSKVIMAAVERELAVPRPLRASRKLLDGWDRKDDQYWFLDEVLKNRADKSLEHVFSLLALELPSTPLKVAFRALHSDDRMLRGLALEYLEGSLPREVFEHLVAFLESGPMGTTARPREEVLQELLASQDTITSRLRIPSADAPG